MYNSTKTTHITTACGLQIAIRFRNLQCFFRNRKICHLCVTNVVLNIFERKIKMIKIFLIANFFQISNE